MIHPNGTIDIPFGTITVEETKAPESYLLKPTYIINSAGEEAKSLAMNVNYKDSGKASLTFAGTNKDATVIQAQLEGDVTTVSDEVMLPRIITDLTASNRTKFTEAISEVRLTDKITLENCESFAKLGTEIRVTGQLIDVETGKPVILRGGRDSVTTVFTVTKATEYLSNLFLFDATQYAGHTLVATEYISYDTPSGSGTVLHGSLKDEAQMVHFPKIGTTNLGKETQKHIANIHGDIVLEDTVRYENLEPNKTYTVNGKLMDKNTGAPVLDENGNEVTASTTFTTGAAIDDDVQTMLGFDEHSVAQYGPDHKATVSGTTVVTFTFRASEAAKNAAQKYVAFENIPGYATHAELGDEDQTVYFPHVDTIASNAKNNEAGNYHGYNTIAMEYVKEVKIQDKVAVTGVSPDAGTLTLYAYLYDVETGKQLYNADGTPVTGSTTFTADVNGNATETVYFNTFDATTLTFEDGSWYNAEGKTVVVFEYLHVDNGAMVGLEAELTSIDQSVIFPEMHTTATEDKMNGQGDHYIPSYDEDYPNSDVMFIQDVVEYYNLLPNTEYHIEGWLVNKATGENILNKNGEEVKAETDFTTGAANTGRGLVDGSITLKFQVTASMMKGVTTVAFEKLTLDGLEVITHANINDHKQTDYFPGGHTVLTDSETEDHMANADESVELIDTVYYENLKPETTYTIEGRLMRAAENGETPDIIDENGNGAMYLIDGNGNFVKKLVDFVTPAAADGEYSVSGSVEVRFELNAKNMEGKKAVAFETLIMGNRTVFVHHDINDTAQTIYFPKGETTVEDNDTKTHITSEVLEEITLVDHVYYSNVLPEKEYTVEGILMDKETGAPLLTEDGETITASATFVSPQANAGEETVSGMIDVTFVFKGGHMTRLMLTALLRSINEISIFAIARSEGNF